MKALHDNLVLGTASVIDDDVTTTDELIPSGESSSYRSNPYRLSRLTLSRRDPEYVGRADKVAAVAKKFYGEEFDSSIDFSAEEASMAAAVAAYEKEYGSLEGSTGIGSLVTAVRPGDDRPAAGGSAPGPGGLPLQRKRRPIRRAGDAGGLHFSGKSGGPNGGG